MLIGQYASKLTDKDRVSVPKRQELGEEFVVARWYERCLVLVSKETWKSLLKRLTGEAELVTASVRDVDRFIFGMAYEVELDQQGRFIIPKKLLDYSEIQTEAIFVGLGDRVEIWAVEKWNELEKVTEKKAAEAIEQISKT